MVTKLFEMLSFIDRNFLNNGDTFNDCLFPTLNSRVPAVSTQTFIADLSPGINSRVPAVTLTGTGNNCPHETRLFT